MQQCMKCCDQSKTPVKIMSEVHEHVNNSVCINIPNIICALRC